MSELTGLAAIRAYKKKMAEEAAAREARKNEADGPKLQFLTLKDGESVKVRFLQEMDEDSKNFNPKRGIGMGAIEHQGLDSKFKYRALCTIESGKCWPCEQVRQAKKGDPATKYSQRRNYYINALVDFGDGEEPQVYIINRGLNSSFIAQLMDEVDEEETIMGQTYKITRQGEGTGTTWMLRPLPRDTTFDSVELDEVETFDIGKRVLRSVPYEIDYENKQFGQEKYYTQNDGDWVKTFVGDEDKKPSSESNESAKPSVTPDMDW